MWIGIAVAIAAGNDTRLIRGEIVSSKTLCNIVIVVKLGVDILETEFDICGRAITVLGDNDICFAYLALGEPFCALALTIEIVVPVDEAYHIRVLLDGS